MASLSALRWIAIDDMAEGVDATRTGASLAPAEDARFLRQK
jgi:hypothetical protein